LPPTCAKPRRGTGAIQQLEQKQPDRPSPYLRGTVLVGKSEFDRTQSYEKRPASISYVPTAVALVISICATMIASAKNALKPSSAAQGQPQGADGLASIASQERNEAEMIKMLRRAKRPMRA
jgi:hypothetical protein